jgi:hypothetical protein
MWDTRIIATLQSIAMCEDMQMEQMVKVLGMLKAVWLGHCLKETPQVPRQCLVRKEHRKSTMPRSIL